MAHFYRIEPILESTIFSLVRNWSRRVTWLNISQLELANIRVRFPNIQISRALEVFKAFIWVKKYAPFLSLDITCSSRLAVFLEQNCFFAAPNGGSCLYNPVFVDVFRGLFLIQKFARFVTPPLLSISLVDGQGKRYHTLERMVRQNSFCSRYILLFVWITHVLLTFINGY